MASRKSRLRLSAEIPNVSSLEERFLFVNDLTLRQNITRDFQYLIFLIALTAEMDIDDTNIDSSIRRDMIIHTVSIIEALLFYVLRVNLDAQKIESKDVMPADWKYKNLNAFYKIPDSSEEVISAIRYKQHSSLTHQTKLDALNNACLKANIISDPLHKEIDEVRKMRNSIHLAGLKEINHMDKETVDKVFSVAGKIVALVEEKVSVLD